MDKRKNKNKQLKHDKRPSFKPISKDGERSRAGERENRGGTTGSRPKGSKESGGTQKYAKKKSSKPDSELVRLNKYIAAAGICSRREADEQIKAGLVSVNGKVVTEMGIKVGPGDDVRYNGERLKNEKKVYLVLNKPKDYVTTVDDPHAAKTVMELVKNACHERIYPVGRLDRGTTGVLLFTNDGDLTKRLTHPSFNKKKIYHVHLNKNVVHQDLVKLSEGIELDDGVVNADAVAYSNPDSKREVGLEIHSGKNRVIRRMFEKLGYKVVKLDRVYFAGITKMNLSRGRWRFLTDKEIKMLKMNAFE